MVGVEQAPFWLQTDWLLRQSDSQRSDVSEVQIPAFVDEAGLLTFHSLPRKKTVKIFDSLEGLAIFVFVINQQTTIAEYKK